MPGSWTTGPSAGPPVSARRLQSSPLLASLLFILFRLLLQLSSLQWSPELSHHWTTTPALSCLSLPRGSFSQLHPLLWIPPVPSWMASEHSIRRWMDCCTSCFSRSSDSCQRLFLSRLSRLLYKSLTAVLGSLRSILRRWIRLWLVEWRHWSCSFSSSWASSSSGASSPVGGRL